MIEPPPVKLGARQFTVAESLLAVATTLVGVPGSTMVPVPEIASVAGGFPSLLEMVHALLKVPTTVGLNRTVSGSDELAGITVPEDRVVVALNPWPAAGGVDVLMVRGR